MLEDRLLTWRFNRGKAEILQHIYEKYKDDLMTLATALLYDKTAAEDVVQDVFVAFIRSCGKLRLSKSLKGYLTACVANNARNRNRTMQRHQNISLEQAGPIASCSPEPDFSAILGEQAEHLAWALSQLPYSQREVLVLRSYSGMRFRTIAELADESVNTIQGRYRYGLARLRSLLDNEVKR